MTNDIELKPCPFCGGKAHIDRVGTTRVSCIVSCQDCGATVESGETFNQGTQWNTRPTDSGYVQVPVEPTEEMIEAGVSSVSTQYFAHEEALKTAKGNTRYIYKAMIAASQQETDK